MFKGWSKLGILAGGFLIGTYGVKLLSGRDAKKAYTHCTAAVLRMKDQVVKDFTVIGENCGDIAADAKAINEKRAQEQEAEIIENAKEVLSQTEQKEV
jgi:hypothetical protein